MKRFCNKSFHEKKIIVFWLFERMLFFILCRTIGVPVGIFFLAGLYLLEPFKKIRISPLQTQRIGHLACNVDLFCRRQYLNRTIPEDAVHLFIVVDKYVANRHLLAMWARRLTVVDNLIFKIVHVLSGWILRKTRFYVELPMKFNEYAEYQKAPPQLEFTNEEQVLGEKKLRMMGVDPTKDWYVCLFVRDSQYLNKVFKNGNWNYHNYRNSDIESFRSAVEYIIEKGGFVVHMGSHANKFLEIKHEQYINYASKFRDEFMDIYLVANCKFLLGTTGGMADVSMVFDVPRLGVNFAPFGHIPQGKNNLYIPKKLKKQSDMQYIPFYDLLRMGLDREFIGTRFSDLGYQFEDNTDVDILAVTKEMVQRVDGRHAPSREQKMVLDRYFDMFSPENLSFGVSTPIGIDFLTANQSLFSKEETIGE